MKHSVSPEALLWQSTATVSCREGERPIQDVRSPVDDSIVGRVEQATEGDVERLVPAAARAAQAVRTASRQQRQIWLRSMAQSIENHLDELAMDIVMSIGKPLNAAQAEVRRSSAVLRLCADELVQPAGDVLPLDLASAGVGRLGFTTREPFGLVAAVTPFNAPLNLLVQKLGPALAMGNSVIVKPAPEGAIPTLRFEQICRPLLPADSFTTVAGGPNVARAIARHTDVACVSLTGGNVAGEALLGAAGIKPVHLELGSNAPAVVLADADLSMAARKLARSSFEASGQQCISTQRIFVQEEVMSRFLELFIKEAECLNVGDPRERDVSVGPMVRQEARDRVVDLIDEAEEVGAALLLDGRRDDLYLGPTIVRAAERPIRLLHEEAFGPVVVIDQFVDVGEAIAKANSVLNCLQASCFTADLKLALHLGSELRAGAVWINEGTRFRLDNYPFGGVGGSGLGREGIRYAMEAMSQHKFIGINPG